MNYWIASYPRSGNTFLRILFKEVYGIDTWEGYGTESPRQVLQRHKDKNNNKPLFIKTHDLPQKTEIPYTDLKAIYLIRDGRDSVVSMAYHRCNIVKPGSDYLFNLLTGVLAPFNTSFGGWSNHVKQWTKYADIIIKFEDLIVDPITQLKRIEQIIDLPAADYSKIPTFEDLKTKKFSLGSGNKKLNKKQQQKRREKFFREGKVNTWKTKMPKSLLDVFMAKNSKTLKEFGYKELGKSHFILYKKVKHYLQWTVGLVREFLKGALKKFINSKNYDI